MNHDDFSTWEVDLCIPDPDLPDKRCMYSKHEVYTGGTEFSPEEIKARAYLSKKKPQALVDSDQQMATETLQAIESIVKHGEKVPQLHQENNYPHQSTSFYPNVTATSSYQQNSKFLGFNAQPIYSSHQLDEKGDGSQNLPQTSYDKKENSWQNSNSAKLEENNTFMNELWKDETIEPRISIQKPLFQAFQIHEDTKLLKDETLKPTQKVTVKQPFSEQNFGQENPITQQLFSEQINDQENIRILTPQRTPTQSFQQRQVVPIQPYQSPNFAMPVSGQTPNKYTPRQYLSQPLPENPRDNHRYLTQPNYTHPDDIQKPASDLFHIFDDVPTSANLNESNCNTQVFNFNLLVASTPFNQKKMAAQFQQTKLKQEEVDLKVNKQKLFCENIEEGASSDKWHGTQQDKLSMILESTKESCSSSGSSSGGATLKTTTINGYSLKTIPENSMESSSQSKIYVQNPQQINQTLLTEQGYCTIQNDPHKTLQHSHLEPSYRLHTQNDTSNLLGIKAPKTPSPQKNFTQSYLGQSVHISHTIPNQSRVNYSTSIREEQASTQMKRPQIPNDQSYIYIPEDTNVSINTESPNKIQYVDINSPYQSQQYNAKLQRERKVERERFEPKNQEGLFCEGSNDSNSLKDLWGRSPAKGSRMDIDVMSQHSNPDLKMDYDSCSGSEHPLDESILLRTPSDPFSSKITKALLRKVGFPLPRHQDKYVSLQKLPRLIAKETVLLGEERYLLGHVVGKGTYGQVFKATRLSTNELVALKFQKPLNQWEYYICTEIQHRIQNPHVVSITMALIHILLLHINVLLDKIRRKKSNL